MRSNDRIGLNADIMIWTAIECCVGIICASLPAMAPLLKRSQATTTPRSNRIWTSSQSRQLKYPWQRCVLHSQPDVHPMCALEGARREDEDVIRARVLQFSDKITRAEGFDQHRSTTSSANNVVHADEHGKELLCLPHGMGDPWTIQPPSERTLWVPPQSRRF